MYHNILKQIYKNYYENHSTTPEVISSFWRAFGDRHDVAYINGDWSVSGYGLGSFIPKSLKKQVRHFPAIFFSKRLMKQYQCPPKLVHAGHNVSESSNRLFNFDCVKHVLALNDIINHLSIPVDLGAPFSKRNIKVACVIGDGYNYLTSLLKTIDPDLKVISVNLGRSLFFDVFFSQKCLPHESVSLISDNIRKLELLDKYTLLFLEAEKYQWLTGMPIDLFINITSMQEMDPPVIHNYFDCMRQSSSNTVYFYSCNRLEKTLPDETVVRFNDYPWGNSHIVMDELCPWHQEYPEAGFPVWRKFDGPIQHRLVQIK